MGTYRGKPSLDDARVRVDRAKHHIASLEREIAAVLPPNRRITAAVAGGSFMGGGTQYVSAPPILSILIGETIYNLRAALDYLVHELFLLDTGEVHNSTKFLIVDSKKEWHSHLPSPTTTRKQLRKMWLHRLTAAHRAALKALQPYHGCKWTQRLRNLSNPDKHRRLLTIDASVNQSGHGAIGGIGPVMVTFDLATKVAFEDGSPVIETLNLFEKKVINAIDDFDPDFK
jgi:hypothetical protein